MNDSWFRKLFKTDSEKKQTENVEKKMDDSNGNKKGGIVITIGRELGSGGRKVAKKVAEKLNYDYYDKEIITKAAKESGVDENLFKQVDEADLDSFWFEFSKDAYEKEEKKLSFKEMTAADKLFMIQSDTIRNVAEKGSCVIVGRCATYILKNNSKRIFICANEKDRIERIKRSYKVSEIEAKEIMDKSDKKRENYHSYYTNQNWKDPKGYDLVINTSEIGIDKAVEKIIELVKT